MSARPLRLHTPNQEAYITLARQELGTILPGVDWAHHEWDVKPLNNGGSRKIATLLFTRPQSQTDPLPPCFSDLVKASVLLERRGVSSMKMRLDSLRHLWLAIETRLGGDAPSLFTWTALLPVDLELTERIMLERGLKASTVYKMCGALQSVVAKLRSRDVPAVRGNFVTPRPESRDRYTIAGEEARLDYMISDEALEALGAIYSTYGLTVADRLMACLCALQIAGGLRISEILTLRIDCLQVTTERLMMPSGRTEEQEVTALYRAKAKSKRKGGRGKPSYEPIYLTPAQASLATAAVDEVLRLTEPFRERARVLEQNPDRTPLPPQSNQEAYLPFEELPGATVAALFGLPDPAALNKHSKKNLPRTAGTRSGPDGGRPPMMYRVADVETYLHARQPELIVQQDDGTGRPQTLSQTLFIAPVNLFHEQRPANPLLIDRVKHGHVDRWLGGRQGKWPVLSVFERMEQEHGIELREADGSPIRLNSHQFRHWVTTKAVEAGAPDSIIERWQGREHSGDLSAYKHLTREAKLKQLKGALRSGRLKGDFAKVYFALHEDVRDVWLEDQLQAVHVTPLGLCIHDFTISPCPHALNCLRGCSDYVYDPADPGTRVQLIQLRGRTEQTLDQAKAQAALDEDDLAQQWVTDQESTLRNIAEILEMPTEDTAPVRPFENGRSRFQPFGADDEATSHDELREIE